MELIKGNRIKLEPRDPPGEMMAGEIVAVDLPIFFVLPAGDIDAVCFQADENGELAVMVAGGSLWEILP